MRDLIKNKNILLVAGFVFIILVGLFGSAGSAQAWFV
jgi:hypothetical protein